MINAEKNFDDSFLTEMLSEEESREIPESEMMHVLCALIIEWRDCLQTAIADLERGETEQALKLLRKLRDRQTQFIEE